MLIEVEGHLIAIEQSGLAAKVIAAGQVVQPLTQLGRSGVVAAVGFGLHPAEQQLVLQRCAGLPTAWAFQVKAIAIPSGSLDGQMEEAFNRACPNGQASLNERLENVGFHEVGYFDDAGNLCLLVQCSAGATSKLDVYVTTRHFLALALAVLHPMAKRYESSLVQFDDYGGMETRPLDVADKSQVWGCIRDLDLDLRDAALCARYGIEWFSDLSLADLLSPNENTPDF